MRFWGWLALLAAIIIVVVGLLIGRPWTKCHCPLHPHHSLREPGQPVLATTTSASERSAERAGTSGSAAIGSRALSA